MEEGKNESFKTELKTLMCFIKVHGKQQDKYRVLWEWSRQNQWQKCKE